MPPLSSFHAEGKNKGKQVDQDHLEMLADLDTLQRGEVSGELEKEGLTAAQVCSGGSRLK